MVDFIADNSGLIELVVSALVAFLSPYLFKWARAQAAKTETDLDDQIIEKLRRHSPDAVSYVWQAYVKQLKTDGKKLTPGAKAVAMSTAKKALMQYLTDQEKARVGKRGSGLDSLLTTIVEGGVAKVKSYNKW